MHEKPLRVVLCWHMHQPEYRDPVSGTFVAPWTLLHGLKDYTDMAAHLEAEPAARAVVNFSPIVLDQIEALVTQLDAFVDGGEVPAESLLAALGPDGPPQDPDARGELMQACLRAHPDNMIARQPRLARLAALARAAIEEPEAETWLTDNFLTDLVAAYLLAWLGESARDDERARRLLDHDGPLDADEHGELLGLVRDQLAGIIPRWRTLAESGRVELACNPWAHPLVPLLLDFNTATEARPNTPIPDDAYPDGAERVRTHLRAARESHEARFGVAPTGCWPSEGGVCDETLALIAEAGFNWAASGQQVLRHSIDAALAEDEEAADDLHRPRRVADGELVCFFRDDGLSDRIGFTYQGWHAEDAAADLLEHLETIASTGAAGRVVPIILDGENAWEHYPANGAYFLAALYRGLVGHPGIELVTFADCVADAGVEAPPLDHVVAGSWVYGDLTTWIGDCQKNRAWELLLAVRAAVDAAVAEGLEWTPELDRQLAVCEGSDWFWWPGIYNPAETVAAFDALFRRHLAGLCDLAGVEPPAELAHSFAEGHGHPASGGVMRPGE